MRIIALGALLLDVRMFSPLVYVHVLMDCCFVITLVTLQLGLTFDPGWRDHFGQFIFNKMRT